MILTLNIKNLALIKNETIDFEKGLNIITGETGAGKSILVKAISCIFGEDLSKEFISFGEDTMIIEALIETDVEKAKKISLISGIEKLDDNQFIISRIIRLNARTSNKLNGQIISNKRLMEIGDILCDIHNQDETSLLMKKDAQLQLVDTFGGAKLFDLKSEYLVLLNKYKKLKSKKNNLISNNDKREQKIDLLNYQINEIKKINPVEGEDIELQNRKEVLENSEKISISMNEAYGALVSADHTNKNVLDNIKFASNFLGRVSQYDDTIEKLEKKLDEYYWEIEDITQTLFQKIEEFEFSPKELDLVIERLELIRKVKRKYGKTIEEVYEYLNNSINELNEISDIEFSISKLSKELTLIEVEIASRIEEILILRKKACEFLEVEVKKELEDLDMAKLDFEIQLKKQETEYNANANYEAIFLISPNQGQPLKEFSLITSGGEMARVMIVFKNLITNFDNTDTIIFDEIESGVSGPIAFNVGKKIKSISKKHQVICITHTPQVAAFSDSHFNVRKFQENNETKTQVSKLNYEEKQNEIAKLLGGRVISDQAISNAIYLMENALKIKE